MSARRLRWDELPDAHRAVYRDQWAAEREVADWFSLPSLTWEQERAALMAGRSLGWMPEGWVGMGGRRGSGWRGGVGDGWMGWLPEGAVAPPADDTGFDPCDCKAVRDRVRDAMQSHCDDCASCNPEGNTSGTVVVEACWQTLDSLGNPGDCRCTYHCNPALCNDDQNSCGSQETAAGSPACFPDIELTPPSSVSGIVAGRVCGLKDAGWDSCPDYDHSSRPARSLAPVEVSVQSYYGLDYGPLLLSGICGWDAASIISIVEAAYGLLMANADLVSYVLCTTFSYGDDANFMMSGTQPISAVVSCMCHWLAGERRSPWLSVEPGSEPAVSACGTVMAGGRRGNDAQTIGETIHLYVGRLGSTRRNLTDHDTILAQALAFDPGGSGVVSREMCVLVALLAHEMLHVCGFKHTNSEFGDPDDTSSTKFQDGVAAALIARYHL